MRNILVVILLISSPLFSKPLSFKYNNESHTINTKIINKVTYFNLADLQTSIGFEVVVEPTTNRFIFKYQDKEAILIPDNPWLVLDSRIINLPVPPQLLKGILWGSSPVLNELLKYFLKKKAYVEGKSLIIRDTERRIKKIVIDPGHGGKDPGAIGKRGLREKDVALDIAKLVTQLLESELGITCVLTRDKDIFIPLRQRASIANKEKADLFLSIHCNAHRSRSKHGTEVYFLSPAKTTWSRAVEARENASLKYEAEEERGEIESILWDMAQAEFLKESNILAGKLVNSMSSAIRSENRGVKQANFYVLRGTYMPACLLEAEFISNLRGEKKLRKQKFKLKIAKGIVKGVQEFKEWYEKRAM